MIDAGDHYSRQTQAKWPGGAAINTRMRRREGARKMLLFCQPHKETAAKPYCDRRRRWR